MTPHSALPFRPQDNILNYTMDPLDRYNFNKRFTIDLDIHGACATNAAASAALAPDANPSSA